MTPAELRASLRAAMRLQRALPYERAALQPLINAGALVLRATEAAAEATAPFYAPALLRHERRRRPESIAQTVPGDFSPTLYAPEYARTELATQLVALP